MSSYASKRSRRSHRKSRLGCKNCKARRIKCDELKPTCTQCLYHSVECVYSPSPECNMPATSDTLVPALSTAQSRDMVFISSSQSKFSIPKRGARGTEEDQSLSPVCSSPSSALTQKPFEFTATDMALFHHCISAEDLKNHIPNVLIRLGFSFQYLLRLLLAVSGFHLASKSGADNLCQSLGPGIDFRDEAERHLQIAIAEVTATGPCLHQGNSHALYAASIYIFVCSLARGPQPNEYLAFRVDNDKPSLCLFLGLRTILEDCRRNGLATEFSPASSDVPEEASVDAQPDLESDMMRSLDQGCGPFREHSEPLQAIQTLIFSHLPPENGRTSSYCYALESLISRFDSIYAGSAPDLGAELWPQIFSWLYTLPDCVVHDLERRDSIALILFGFFTVLLNELDSVWFIRGWPRHIIIGIFHQLGDDYRMFICWPLSRLGLPNFDTRGR